MTKKYRKLSGKKCDQADSYALKFQMAQAGMTVKPKRPKWLPRKDARKLKAHWRAVLFDYCRREVAQAAQVPTETADGWDENLSPTGLGFD